MARRMAHGRAHAAPRPHRRDAAREGGREQASGTREAAQRPVAEPVIRDAPPSLAAVSPLEAVRPDVAAGAAARAALEPGAVVAMPERAVLDDAALSGVHLAADPRSAVPGSGRRSARPDATPDHPPRPIPFDRLPVDDVPGDDGAGGAGVAGLAEARVDEPGRHEGGSRGCTAPQLRRFIKSRAYVPMHELRRRFSIDGPEDDVTVLETDVGRVFVGLPRREGRLLAELVRQGDVGFELSLDPVSPVVIGVYPMRPVTRT